MITKRMSWQIATIACFLPLLGSCGNPPTGWDESSLKARLHIAASDQLDRSEVALSEDTAEELQRFIDVGVVRLVADQAAPEQVDEALANLSRFLNELTKTPPNKAGEIDKATFEQTMSSICPLYPFCN